MVEEEWVKWGKGLVYWMCVGEGGWVYWCEVYVGLG